MANISRINGFRPVKHLNGSPYNGQANIYEVPAGEATPVFIGDLVVLSTSNATSYYPAVAAVVGSNAQVATGVIIGAVVGILNAKQDPDGKMTTGSISLDVPLYRPASTKQFVLVCDSPDIVYETQADASVALADVGLNVGIGASTHATTALVTGASPMYAYSTTAPSASATRPLQIMAVSTRVDNETASANNKILVRVSTHAYGNAVAGV